MAAGAQGIRAGAAYVEIGSDLGPLEKGMNIAKARLASFAGALGALGSALALGFVTNKISGWVQAFADSGREIFLMARAAGVSTSEISELKSAVQILGGDLGETVGGMRKMGIFLHEVSTGSREATSAMSQLGLTIADIAGMSEIDKLQLIGERLAAIGDLNTRQALGRQIFGRGGGAMVGIAGGLGAARAEAGQSGLSPAQVEEQVRSAFELSQALKMLGKMREQVGKSIGAALAPAFTLVANTISGIVKQARNWVNVNQEVIQKVALIGSGVVAVGLSLKLLTSSLALSIFKWVAIFEIAKFLGTAILNATGLMAGFQSAVARVSGVFNDAFGGIKDAIMGGELELAWEIALQGIKVLWIDFQTWFKTTFNTSVSDIFRNMQIGFVEAMAFIKKAWVETTGFMSGVWNLSENIQTEISIGALRNRARRGEISQDVANATIAQLRAEQDVNNRGGQAAIDAQRRLLGQIEAARVAGLAGIANAPPENLSQDAINAQIRLENLLEAAQIEAGAAEGRRNAGLAGAAAGMEGLGQGSTRSTFNRDVLFGRSGSPVERLIEKTDTMIERLNLLIPIRAELQRLGPAEVG